MAEAGFRENVVKVSTPNTNLVNVLHSILFTKKIYYHTTLPHSIYIYTYIYIYTLYPAICFSSRFRTSIEVPHEFLSLPCQVIGDGCACPQRRAALSGSNPVVLRSRAATAGKGLAEDPMLFRGLAARWRPDWFYHLVMTDRHSHGISMALIEIDGLPIKNGDFPWLC